MSANVLHGDCRDLMREMPAASVDAIVSDPPYGLAFMGKGWDHAVPGVDFWAEALRVAKPGAHLVAFGGTRTFHRLACAIEDAGWTIRDTLSWLYGSGFPKSHNGSWGGTALKPAWEPIILARKPLASTVAANVQQHGTGAINVDACRIGCGGQMTADHVAGNRSRQNYRTDVPVNARPSLVGRWPANVLLDEDAAALLGEPSRFFYTAKASRSEREAGLDQGIIRRVGSLNMRTDAHAERTGETAAPARNHHPTVKPINLMRWLCRLVTPRGGTVLDPFNGSGSTGCAAVMEGFNYIGCELDAEYVEIARQRIAHWSSKPTPQTELLEDAA